MFDSVASPLPRGGPQLTHRGSKSTRTYPLLVDEFQGHNSELHYYDKAEFVTEEAEKIRRLHTHLPGWMEANLAFLRGGGFSGPSRIANVSGLTIENLLLTPVTQ